MLNKKALPLGSMILLVLVIGFMPNHFAQPYPATEGKVADFSGSYDGVFKGTGPGRLTAILVQDEDTLTGIISMEFEGSTVRTSRLEATVEGTKITGEAIALDGTGVTTRWVGYTDSEPETLAGYFMTSTGQGGDFYIDKLKVAEPLDLTGFYFGTGFNAMDLSVYTMSINMRHTQDRLFGDVQVQTMLGLFTGTLTATLVGDYLENLVLTLGTPLGPISIPSPNSFVTSDGGIILGDLRAGDPLNVRGSFIVRRR